jgi:metal-responsive CopG/Arc/MetJ family transcriptional regulator
MGRLSVDIPDELETELRSVVPNKRGALSDTVTKAIRSYLKERRKNAK